jgi:hypothetical protein
LWQLVELSFPQKTTEAGDPWVTILRHAQAKRFCVGDHRAKFENPEQPAASSDALLPE